MLIRHTACLLPSQPFYTDVPPHLMNFGGKTTDSTPLSSIPHHRSPLSALPQPLFSLWQYSPDTTSDDSAKYDMFLGIFVYWILTECNFVSNHLSSIYYWSWRLFSRVIKVGIFEVKHYWLSSRTTRTCFLFPYNMKLMKTTS